MEKSRFLEKMKMIKIINNDTIDIIWVHLIHFLWFEKEILFRYIWRFLIGCVAQTQPGTQLFWFSGPQNRFWGPQNQFWAPQNRFWGPQNRLWGPPNRFWGPQNWFWGLQNWFGDPQNQFRGPQTRFWGWKRNLWFLLLKSLDGWWEIPKAS